MKISIIGAGNVGSLTAMRLAQERLGSILMVDVAGGLAKGKALDLEDCRSILKNNYDIKGTDQINDIKDSDIIVITAGLTRKPGMSREELLNKNTVILKEISLSVKKHTPQAIVIVVTNPLDLMTYVVLNTTGFPPNRVLGMGVSLDAARFANLISKELNVPASEVEACVIGSHGEGMLPMGRFSKIKDKALTNFIDDSKIEKLTSKTINRGAEIVALLASGSAFFAPSASVSSLVKSIIKDDKQIIGVCAYLNGQYGVTQTCIGVPCRIGRQGIEQIVELDLNEKEINIFRITADKLKAQYKNISL